ncbi:MAG TPA: heavy-metal-associated domain-containing protein [Polyangiaceae bacterium]|nr:heavy-metal-associated domain-containing protein [Polyangiaceae bacterium]
MSNAKETLLLVEGMACPSCIQHLQSALRELDGIGKVEVNLEVGTVRVQHDPARTSAQHLIQALGEAGYESRCAGYAVTGTIQSSRYQSSLP